MGFHWFQRLDSADPQRTAHIAGRSLDAHRLVDDSAGYGSKHVKTLAAEIRLVP